MTITFTGKVKETATQKPNVRVQADTSASLVTSLAPGTTFQAQGAKVTNDGYEWLNLVSPVAGWLAITSNIEYQAVAPPAPGIVLPRLEQVDMTLHLVYPDGTRATATYSHSGLGVEFVKE